MDDVDEIVHEFLVESHENLDQLDQDLVALESSPGSRDLLSSVFRTIHTIKGTSGFLAFGALERLTHAGESLLAELRDGRRTMDRPTTDVLLRMVDTVREILGAIDRDGTEGDVAVDPVIAALDAVLHAAGPTAPDRACLPAPGGPASAAAAAPAVPAPTLAAAPTAAPTAGPAPTAVVPAPVMPTEEMGALRAGAADSAIRVDVDLLDALMRQVGELVLSRNQITRLAAASADAELTRSAQRLNLIAGELQQGVMKTRMQPIEHLWATMPRVVRDLAASCGREVVLEMTGGDTELDRGLLEAVKDPLTHLVRNAVDHGIESPADRVAAGKPPRGVLSLRAFHASGQVIVEVGDDGRGIDPAEVAATAVRRGLRTAEQAAAMSVAELQQLLFLPGFSTTQAVTNVSGRGVGMDVVRTKVEAIGGTVEVESALGRGTLWRLRIPLTLAIMPALTIGCGGDQYAVPQANLLELVALDGRGGPAIEHVHSAPVYRLRGDLLPLVRLADVLGLAGPPRDAVDADHATTAGPDAPADAIIAVVQADQRRFGLVVDEVLNTEEIVVKPLAARLTSIGLYAGATVLGDGTVALILDVQAIARRSLVEDVDRLARDERAAREAADRAGAARVAEQVLVAGVGDGRRVAMPVASVTRLERIRADQVERVGARTVVQYRGTILPLVRLDRLLGAQTAEDRAELLVVVYTAHGRSVGLVVDEIHDIVADDVARHAAVEDSGLLGATVLGDRVTELLDVRSAVLAADPTFFDEVVAGAATDRGAAGPASSDRGAPVHAGAELVGSR